MEIDWSKAPEVFPLWLEDIRKDINGECRSGWARQGKGEYEFPGGGWWTVSHENVLYKIHKKIGNASEWTGENGSLPPVGLTVEAYFPSDTRPEWLLTKLLYVSDQSVIYSSGVGECEEILTTRESFNTLQVKFRPIRTAEQKAAEERENAVKAMIEDSQSDYSAGELLNASEHVECALYALYDAGYRKAQP